MDVCVFASQQFGMPFDTLDEVREWMEVLISCGSKNPHVLAVLALLNTPSEDDLEPG